MCQQVNFALPPADCFSSGEENPAWPCVVKIPFPSPAGLSSLQSSTGLCCPTASHRSWVQRRPLRGGCSYCYVGFHLPIPSTLTYSRAQAASMQGLTEEEKGRGGHKVELTTVETPVFSTFRQMALRVWVPSPQLVEH